MIKRENLTEEEMKALHVCKLFAQNGFNIENGLQSLFVLSPSPKPQLSSNPVEEKKNQKKKRSTPSKTKQKSVMNNEQTTLNSIQDVFILEENQNASILASTNPTIFEQGYLNQVPMDQSNDDSHDFFSLNFNHE